VKRKNEEQFDEELVYNTNLKFLPPVLDFKERWVPPLILKS